MLARLLRPIVQFRDGEAATGLLMFLYSFLAMTSYNIIKPISKSEFIGSLGADDLPWVTFAMGVMIGVIMQGYTRVIALVPRRSMIPVTQVGIAAMLLLFWVLFTFIGADWVAVAFYIVVQILAILLISQFWTLANDVYDPRQAKRIFGFIGGGASLGGATGAGLTAFLVRVGRLAHHDPDGRRRHARLPGDRRDDRPPREIGGHLRRVEDRRGRQASAAAKRFACCGRRGTCRSSRWSSPSGRWRRTSSISRSAWRSPSSRARKARMRSPSSSAS